jgi:hypothetical protein
MVKRTYTHALLYILIYTYITSFSHSSFAVCGCICVCVCVPHVFPAYFSGMSCPCVSPVSLSLTVSLRDTAAEREETRGLWLVYGVGRGARYFYFQRQASHFFFCYSDVMASHVGESLPLTPSPSFFFSASSLEARVGEGVLCFSELTKKEKGTVADLSSNSNNTTKRLRRRSRFEECTHKHTRWRLLREVGRQGKVGGGDG